MNHQEGLYLEDLYVGQRFTSGTYRMDEERIKAFAAEFDPQPFHLDQAAAQGTVFGVCQSQIVAECAALSLEASFSLRLVLLPKPNGATHALRGENRKYRRRRIQRTEQNASEVGSQLKGSHLFGIEAAE